MALARRSKKGLLVKPTRWGVIGVGRFGSVHARTLAGLPDTQLVALCGRRPDTLAQLAAELGVPWTSDDYHSMLEGDRVDAVVIATHWRDHAVIACDALRAGKHVLLEKPMAAGSDECREVLEATRHATGYLMVGHVCRFDTRVALARQAIVEGRLGRIVSIHARRNLPRAPGSLRLDKISPLMGDGIHDTDLILWFLGMLPSRIYARCLKVHDYTYPDLGWAFLEFENQAVGVVETVWCLPENVPTVIDARMEVIGTEGKLTIDCSQSGLSLLDAQGLGLPDTAYWPKLHGRHVGALACELAYFTQCIRTRQPPQVITPLEAARAVAVMEAAELAAQTGQVLDFRAPY